MNHITCLGGKDRRCDYARLTLTLGRLMIAVVAIASFLALERLLYRSAVRALSSHAEGDYYWGEAMTVWLILNIVLAVPVGMIGQMAQAHMAHRAGDQTRTG